MRWQGRAILRLKSSHFAEISTLIGQLQTTLQLAGIEFSVSDRARTTVEMIVIPETNRQLRAQAQLVAQSLEKPSINIKKLDINQINLSRQPIMLHTAATSNPPLSGVTEPQWEPGNSTLQLQATGRVELR